jgi:hypothetical protein
MPRSLPTRFLPESQREFRNAALRRYQEGVSLSLAGRDFRTGAIYLWGYCAEMTLKAAYFRLLGHAETAPITWNNIFQAIHRARTAFGVAWPNRGQGHNVRAWAELLIAERASIPGSAYPPAFGLQVQQCGQLVGQLWSETIRYHKNVAYLHEMQNVRDAAEWYLANESLL